jgi:hypothetical protein
MNHLPHIDPKSALTVPASGTDTPSHSPRLRYVSNIPGRAVLKRQDEGKQKPLHHDLAEQIRQMRDADGVCSSCHAEAGQRHNKWCHAWGLILRRVRLDYPGAKRITAKPLGPEKLPFGLDTKWQPR